LDAAETARKESKGKEEKKEYKEACEAAKQNGDDFPPPPKPEKKLLYEVATIQAVMKRMAEQGVNGSLWARDEIKGLFQSLGQFSPKGESEGMAVLLKTWDGQAAIVDRVLEEDSFVIGSTMLNISGGIQPLVYPTVFRNRDDANGAQARFLWDVPQPMPAKRVKAACQLADELPGLYEWIGTFPEGDIKLSRAADDRYDNLYESMGLQAEQAQSPAVRNWLRKLHSQLLRIAFALHIMECYYETGRPKHELQLDTLNRAVEVARYYRACFMKLQESLVEPDATPSILKRILDLAAKSPNGITARDAYRGIKPIQQRAKESGRAPATYTLDLFGELVLAGRGTVQKDGRQTRFVISTASVTVPPAAITTAQQAPQVVANEQLGTVTIVDEIKSDDTPPDDEPPEDTPPSGGSHNYG